MRPQHDLTGTPADAAAARTAEGAVGQVSFGRLQAAWERSGRAMRAALQAWQESCAVLLAALRRGDANEVAVREEACVDRQRALDAATAREAAARDRYLAAFLHPRSSPETAPDPWIGATQAADREALLVTGSAEPLR